MKTTFRFILYVLIVGVSANAIYGYGFRPLGAGLPPPMMQNFQAHQFAIYTHVFASVLALLLGPLQFSTWLRQRHRQLHRWIGRAYLGIGVLFGGLAGLYMAQFSFGGLGAKLGFACLAVASLFTGVKAYLSIRAGAVEQHRAYMVRNYSLILAAVSLRIYIPFSIIAGIDFESAYPVIAWLCWIPNLLLAEWLCNRNGQHAASHREQGRLVH